MGAFTALLAAWAVMLWYKNSNGRGLGDAKRVMAAAMSALANLQLAI